MVGFMRGYRARRQSNTLTLKNVKIDAESGGYRLVFGDSEGAYLGDVFEVCSPTGDRVGALNGDYSELVKIG